MSQTLLSVYLRAVPEAEGKTILSDKICFQLSFALIHITFT